MCRVPFTEHTEAEASTVSGPAHTHGLPEVLGWVLGPGWDEELSSELGPNGENKHRTGK